MLEDTITLNCYMCKKDFGRTEKDFKAYARKGNKNSFCSYSCFRDFKNMEKFDKNSILERFFEKVNKSPGLGPSGDCWEWAGRLTRLGYGRFRIREVYQAAHRQSFRLFNGEIPEDLIVRHKCDNRKCVNPEHLELGTHQDNSNDAVERGRTTRGEQTYTAKLKEIDVLIIRFLYDNGVFSQANLGHIYEISLTNSRSVTNFETWRHLPSDEDPEGMEKGIRSYFNLPNRLTGFVPQIFLEIIFDYWEQRNLIKIVS